MQEQKGGIQSASLMQKQQAQLDVPSNLLPANRWMQIKMHGSTPRPALNAVYSQASY